MTRAVKQRQDLGELTKIGQGGHGVVYRAPRARTHFSESMVYKEYKPQVRGEIDFDALTTMPLLVEDSLSYRDGERLMSLAAWPCEIVQDSDVPAGFLMPAIPERFSIALKTMRGVSRSPAEFQHLLNSEDVLQAREISINDAQRYALLDRTASALAFLHSLDVCVGDISPRNLLFSLESGESVYFIDCDAMRIKGKSVLPQAETPGWEVPAGQELATAQSDSYKFGLLALRLLAGSQTTRNVADLPTTVPAAVRKLITDSLQRPPTDRPRPKAWVNPLSQAIEEAQQRPKPPPTPKPQAPKPQAPKPQAPKPQAPKPQAPPTVTPPPACSNSKRAWPKLFASKRSHEKWSRGEKIAAGLGGLAFLIFHFWHGSGNAEHESNSSSTTTSRSASMYYTPTSTITEPTQSVDPADSDAALASTPDYPSPTTYTVTAPPTTYTVTATATPSPATVTVPSLVPRRTPGPTALPFTGMGATQQLAQYVRSDLPFVREILADRWVPQLSSKRPGVVDDGVVWDDALTLQEHLRLRRRYPGVRLLWSGDWSTFSSPNFWVTIAGVTFSDSAGALAWCRDAGLDSDHCVAKVVSTTWPVAGSTAYN